MVIATLPLCRNAFTRVTVLASDIARRFQRRSAFGRTPSSRGLPFLCPGNRIVRQAHRPRARGVLLFAATLVLAAPPPLAAQLPRDGQRDFDFELGSWKALIRRLTKPLTGSNAWVEYEGTSVVRPLWGGRANLGELDVRDTAGSRIVGLSLRLYDPDTRQWKIHWANARDGELGPAMIGGFANGRGEFYNQERFDGKAVFVRFIFSDVTATTFRLEQAFSPDGGKTWEPNWIATFTRQSSRGLPLG